MTDTVMSFVGDTIQCWGCPIFDRLFQIISVAAATFYEYLSDLCLIVFMASFTVFVVNAIWQNAKKGFEDTWYTKSIQKVFINSGCFLSDFITFGLYLISLNASFKVFSLILYFL